MSRTQFPRSARTSLQSRTIITLALLAMLLAPSPSYAARDEFTRTTTIPGQPRYFNYVSPPGVGDDAGEPSLGINYTTEQTFSNSNGPIPNGGTVNYFGGFLPYMLKVTFNDCQSPALVTWDQKPLLLAATPRVFGDPILYTDKATGRTLVAQLEGLTPLGSTTDFTDDDGDTFGPTEGSGLPSCIDHQTLGGGPFAPPLTSPLYPNAVYYCSQCVSNATCSLSLDGGITFLPGVSIFTVADCAGLHGHVKVANDGTVYIPDKGCGGIIPLLFGGEVAVVVSEDNGVTWNIRTVPNEASNHDGDPSVGIANDGTIYLGWNNIDNRPRVAVSHDKGETWSNIRFVGDDMGIEASVFPAVVAGDGDRAAIAYYGTTHPASNYDAPGFPGIWHLYISSTFDGGNTWSTVNVTPNDPIQRGGICPDGDCRNMLDFFDASIDTQGRVLVAWDDGCVGGCVNGPPNSFAAKAAITRQSGGMRMLSAFDPVEPRIAEAPGVGGFRVDDTVFLSWPAPDNGGATITEYKIYRSDGGAFSHVATVNETSFQEDVTPGDKFYRVTAVNSEGEGPYCNDYLPITDLPPTPCDNPGVRVVNDTLGDGSDDDAGANLPPDPSVNVRQLYISEPWLGQGVEEVWFTLQVEPTTGSVPISSQWYIVWNRLSTAPDGSDRRFVSMETDALGEITFRYGDFGPPLPVGDPPPTNANTPLPLGDADFGSYDPETGIIFIRLSTDKVNSPTPVAGNDLAGTNVRTYFNRPDPGQRSQNNASDITGDGNYTMVGNAACFFNSPPVARLSADPTSGNAPLLVDFDASASSDNDPLDAVVSYTFNFGDGTDPVTTGNPTISHNYDTPSGTSGFFATLTVEDTYGEQSLNVAKVTINVERTTSDTEPDDEIDIPATFGLSLRGNPSHGQLFLNLAMDRDGPVNIRVYDPSGRRVADLLDASMPAGRHALHWRGLDDNGKRVAAGLYFVRANASGRQVVQRVVLLH